MCALNRKPAPITHTDLSPLCSLKHAAQGLMLATWPPHPSPHLLDLTSGSAASLCLFPIPLPLLFVPLAPRYSAKAGRHHTETVPTFRDPSSSSSSAAEQLGVGSMHTYTHTHTPPHSNTDRPVLVCQQQGQSCWPLRLWGRARSWWWDLCPLATNGPLETAPYFDRLDS